MNLVFRPLDALIVNISLDSDHLAINPLKAQNARNY